MIVPTDVHATCHVLRRRDGPLLPFACQNGPQLLSSHNWQSLTGDDFSHATNSDLQRHAAPPILAPTQNRFPQ